MALIGKIRNNSWLLIVLIGLGLGGFLLMDMTSSGGAGGGLFGGSQNSLGSIQGKSIEAQDFFKTEDILYSGGSSDIYNRRATLWNYFVENEMVKEQSDALGLTLTQEEFTNLQFGANPSQIISASFRNPQTGQIDRAQLNQIKQAIETNQIQNPNFASYWYELQKQIKKDGLQQKLNTLVSKGMYTPTWMVENYHNDQNQKVDFTYVRIPYDQVDNSDVSLSDADYKAYLAENMGKYKKSAETRKVGYVSFEVKATAKDSAAIFTELSKESSKLESSPADSVELFITSRQGIYDEAYVKKDQLSPIIADQIFDAENGSVYGPYQDGNDYKVAKVIDRMVVPDSVKARHILIKVNDAGFLAIAEQRIDSLMTVLENGTTPWDTLVANYSEDQASLPTAGDLGYSAPGRMVKPFNDMIFYQAKGREYNKVFSQFGYHIIQVTDRKFINNEEAIKVAYLREPIIPSSDTQKDVYRKVGTFISENRTLDKLKAAVDANPELDYNTSLPVAKNDFSIGTLGANQATREMIKFAFNGKTSLNDVSQEVYVFRDPVENYEKDYVVAVLDNIIPKGNPSVANIKDQIEGDVMNIAKAKILTGKISGTDLNAIASTFESSVDTVTNASFTSSFLKGLGNEPKVVASAFNMETGNVSKPIVGANGVYIIKLLNKTGASTAPNIPTLRAQVSRPYQSQVAGQLLESMKNGMDIKDNRSIYY